jgi:formylmethanofuran dehydrogenase subunit A
VLKAGELIVEEAQLRRAPAGARFSQQPGYDDAAVPSIRDHFDRYSTVSFENYPVRRA